MICSQEGEKGIECLHVMFTLAKDVFESRTTQKGENVEYMFKSRTTQMQERENDEDIINMDTPTVVAYDSMVKLFFSISIFNTCDEWTLHHDMCSMSFIEVLTWIKEGMDHAWKGWIMKHLDWGPNTSAPYTSTKSDEIMATPGANIRVPPWPPPCTIRGGHGIVVVWKINLSRGRLKCKKGMMMRHHFYGYNLAYSLELEFDLFPDCRKAPTCNSCTASYGFQFGSSTTPWKDHKVYFEMDPASCGYLIGVGHNH
jgi:hypothetical protein